MNKKMVRALFFLSPFGLMIFVFLITLTFSGILKTLFLAGPLLAAYYTYIWVTFFLYDKKKAGGLFHAVEFSPIFRQLRPWMILWIWIYPFASGLPAFLYIIPNLNFWWIPAGLVFSLINGPSEEIYWRLFLERAGEGGGVSARVRLFFRRSCFHPGILSLSSS